MMCGLSADGQPTCWYRVDDDLPALEAAIPSSPVGFWNLGVGLYSVCGISREGDLSCWGELPASFPYAATSSADACADGSVEADASWWGREDIAYCEFPFDANDVSLAEAEAHCATDWHICTSDEFTARNDDFINVGSRTITARIADGNTCFVHDNNDDSNGRHDMTSDGVRAGAAGTCDGTQSSTSWARQGVMEDALCVDDLWCGVLCCP